MGTRADFYVGQGADAEWLGSIAWDGYPDGIFEGSPEMFTTPLLPTVEEWRDWVAEYLSGRRDATLPERGWPWPWRDSGTTDYAYTLIDGEIHGSSYGGPWFKVDPAAEGWVPDEDPAAPRATFPDMSARKNVRFDEGSGAIFLTAKRDPS